MTPARLAFLLPLAFAALVGLPSFAHAAPSIPLPWSVGTKLEYLSTTVNEKVARGVRRVTTTQAVSTVEVIEAGPTGFVQVWSDDQATVKVEGDGAGLAAEQQSAQAMLERFEGVPLEAQLDAQGRFTGIRNWQVLGAKMREELLPVLLAQARARPEAAPMAQADLEARLKPVLERMTTQAVIDASLGKNPSIYNAFTAPKVAAGAPVRYEDVLRSPVSDHAIPAIGTIELVGADAQADTVTIRWTQSIDPHKGLAAAWQMVEALTGAPLPAARTQLPEGLVLRDEATITVHRRTGVPQHLVHRRELALGDQVRRATWTLALRGR